MGRVYSGWQVFEFDGEFWFEKRERERRREKTTLLRFHADYNVLDENDEDKSFFFHTFAELERLILQN